MSLPKTLKTKHWLLAIIVLAAVLRLFWLSRGDPMNDEVAIAFRAVGLVDSFNDPNLQSTPWEWFDPDIPQWAKISFHDHPPLVFWIQNLFMRMLGETLWAARLAAALFGVASIWLLYLISSRLYSPRIGLLSAGLFAATANHVYISRTAQQEAFVIFFILLAIYFFVRALENTNFMIWTGLATGLALLTKYTALILLPIFITYLALYRRDYFKERKLWFAALIALLLFSPVVIYNLKLYQAVGHFDFQFHHVFGQEAKEWPREPGKEIGSLASRLAAFVPRLVASNSWILLSIFAASVLAFLYELRRDPGPALRKHNLLALILGFLFVLLLFIGPAIRFLTMLTPFMALAAAAAIGPLAQKMPRVAWLSAVILIFAFEIFYTANNQILPYPKGPMPWLASRLRYENYNWGYSELEEYLAGELKGKYPALTFETKFNFINEIQKSNTARAQKSMQSRVRPYFALIIYYGDFDPQPELWIASRRLMYHGWPIMTFPDYRRTLESAGSDVYTKAGFKSYYFIVRANITLPESLAAAVKNAEIAAIKNKRGEEVFRIYKVTVS